MIRAYRLLKLKLRSWMLYEEAVHVEGLMSDHKRRYELLLLELRKVRGQIATLERPEVLLTQALRRAR